MISLKHHFLFIHVPKTGGNSIQSALAQFSEDEIVSHEKEAAESGMDRFGVRNKTFQTNKHSPLRRYKRKLDPEVFARLFKFATVRNPWDRVVSHYFSPHKGRTEFQRPSFLRVIRKTKPLEFYLKAGRQTPEEPISVFQQLNYLIKFESLEEDFKKVCEALSLPSLELPHKNSSEKNHYSSYYDEETIELVRTKFAAEIQFGNYAFEKK